MVAVPVDKCVAGEPIFLFRFSDAPFYRTPFPTGYGSPHLILLTTSLGPTDIKQGFLENYHTHSIMKKAYLSSRQVYSFLAPPLQPPTPTKPFLKRIPCGNLILN